MHFGRASGSVSSGAGSGAAFRTAVLTEGVSRSDIDRRLWRSSSGAATRARGGCGSLCAGKAAGRAGRVRNLAQRNPLFPFLYAEGMAVRAMRCTYSSYTPPPHSTTYTPLHYDAPVPPLPLPL